MKPSATLTNLISTSPETANAALVAAIQKAEAQSPFDACFLLPPLHLNVLLSRAPDRELLLTALFTSHVFVRAEELDRLRLHDVLPTAPFAAEPGDSR